MRSEVDAKVQKSLYFCKRRAWGMILSKTPVLSKGYQLPPRDALVATTFRLCEKGEDVRAEKLKQHISVLEREEGGLPEHIDAVVSLLLMLQGSLPYEKNKGPSQVGDCVDRKKVEEGKYPHYSHDMFDFCEGQAKPPLYPKPNFAFPSAGVPPLRLKRSGLGTGIEEEVEFNAVEHEQHDEGYASPLHYSDEGDIWDLALASPPSKHSWQNPGFPASRMPSMPTESGPGIVHYCWALASENLQLILPSFNPAEPVVVADKLLTHHIGLLIAGLPSTSFPFCQGRSSFTVAPGLCLSSTTPESLESLCGPCIETANLVRQLEALHTSTIQQGNVWAGFQAGLRTFLRQYVTAVLAIAARVQGLGALLQALRPLQAQVNFLGRVCFSPDTPVLPNGVSLISKLLDVSVHVSNKQVHLLLISLLAAVAAPYFRFLQSWLFSGSVQGWEQEFGLRIDPRFLGAFDASYWTNAFTLVPVEGSSFLADIQIEVHRVGKSLALLRRLSPQHYLAGRHRHLEPKLRLAVTVMEQGELRIECAHYEERMKGVAEDESITLAQREEEEEKRKEETREELRRKHRNLKEEREKALEAARVVKFERQREVRDQLEKQVEEVRLRKEKEATTIQDEQKKIQAEAERMEEALKKREEEDRKQVEEFYAKLEREATQRERRAEWKLRRGDPCLVKKRRDLYQQMQEVRVKEVDKLSDLKEEGRLFALTAELVRENLAVESIELGSSLDKTCPTSEDNRLKKDLEGNVIADMSSLEADNSFQPIGVHSLNRTFSPEPSGLQKEEFSPALSEPLSHNFDSSKITSSSQLQNMSR